VKRQQQKEEKGGDLDHNNDIYKFLTRTRAVLERKKKDQARKEMESRDARIRRNRKEAEAEEAREAREAREEMEAREAEAREAWDEWEPKPRFLPPELWDHVVFYLRYDLDALLAYREAYPGHGWYERGSKYVPREYGRSVVTFSDRQQVARIGMMEKQLERGRGSTYHGQPV